MNYIRHNYNCGMVEMENYNKHQDHINLHLSTSVIMVHDYETGENSIVQYDALKSFFTIPQFPPPVVGATCCVGEPGPMSPSGYICSNGLVGTTGPQGVAGFCGSTGFVEDSKPYANELITTKDLPKIFTLNMVLRPKQDQRTDKIYQDILDFAYRLPGAQVTSVAPIKRTRTDFTLPKAEFLTEVEKITHRNATERKRYEQLSNELKDMGVKVGEFRGESIPSHYYETYDYYDYYRSCVNISCHCKVEAYDVLVGMGLVLKALKPSEIEILKHKKYNQRLIDALPRK